MYRTKQHLAVFHEICLAYKDAFLYNNERMLALIEELIEARNGKATIPEHHEAHDQQRDHSSDE